jgi:hypothetical protein
MLRKWAGKSKLKKNAEEEYRRQENSHRNNGILEWWKNARGPVIGQQ